MILLPKGTRKAQHNRVFLCSQERAGSKLQSFSAPLNLVLQQLLGVDGSDQPGDVLERIAHLGRCSFSLGSQFIERNALGCEQFQFGRLGWGEHVRHCRGVSSLLLSSRHVHYPGMQCCGLHEPCDV